MGRSTGGGQSRWSKNVILFNTDYLIEREEKTKGSQDAHSAFVFHLLTTYMVNSAPYKTKKINYSSLSLFLYIGKLQFAQTNTAGWLQSNY